jgi:hypothetical protein
MRSTEMVALSGNGLASYCGKQTVSSRTRAEAVQGEAGVTKAGRALVAIADRENRESVVQALAACGLEPIFCSSADDVRAVLESGSARRVVL